MHLTSLSSSTDNNLGPAHAVLPGGQECRGEFVLTTATPRKETFRETAVRGGLIQKLSPKDGASPEWSQV